MKTEWHCRANRSGTPYDGHECPTCKAEREDAKGVIERRLRDDREEKDKRIRDVEEWLKGRRGIPPGVRSTSAEWT